MLKKLKKLKIKKVFIFSLLALCVGLFSFWYFSKPAVASWFDENWLYRKSIPITNNGSAQTNYQIQVVVDTSTPITAGKMQSSCNDMRFTDQSGKLLPFWIEAGCNSATTSVWVKIPSITASSTSTLFMYYGNSSAPKMSAYSSTPTGINVGNGADGTCTVSADTNINSASCAGRGTADAINTTVSANTASGQNQVTVASATGFTANDEILIINLQGTSGDNSNVGKYETARISSIASTTFTLDRNLTNTYDGTTQKIMVQRVPNYTTVTVDSTKTMSATAWNGTQNGVLFFRATGTTSITGTISMSGSGYTGGVHGNSGGYYVGQNSLAGGTGYGPSGESGSYSGGGGGGVTTVGQSCNGVSNSGAGGSGGGYSTAGTIGGSAVCASPGAIGPAFGSANLSQLYMGGGGGGGGGNTGYMTVTPNASEGAAGGGIISVNTNQLTVNNGGIIRTNGGTGTNGTPGNSGDCYSGGAGGGAGGSILLYSPAFTNNGSVTATAGNGGNGNNGGASCNDKPSGNGGNGGDGRIAANYSTSSGTTNPSSNTSVLPTSGTLASEEQGPGPIAYWKFDEGQGQTINDSSSAKNNGTLGADSSSSTDDPTWQTEDQCISGKCLKFDGSNDLVKAGSSPSTSGALTISTWIKPAGYGGGTLGRIFDNGKAILYLTSGNVLKFSGDGNTDAISNSNAITLNSWTHVVITRAASTNTVYFYVNGKAWGSGDAGTPADGSTTLFIGNRSAGDRAFNGFVDEVKIYPYTRTGAQIKQDYASGKANAGTKQGNSASLGAKPEDWLSNGLVGYWKMDETATPSVDSSGNGNSGTWNGNTATAAGKFGNGTAYDGSGDYVEVKTTALIDGNTQGTVAAWVKSNNTNSSEDAIYAENGTNGVVFSLNRKSTNKFEFQILTSSSGWAATDDTTTMSSGTWYHVVGVFSATERNIKLYVNGNLKATTAWDGTFANTGPNVINSVRISGYSNGTSYAWDGVIDDVRTYNRALSPKEVSDLYNWAPGPVGYWKMDDKVDGDAKTIVDSSGNGNNGTTVDGANNTGMSCNQVGKYGGACNFDGVDDYINLVASNTYAMKSTTIMAWVYINLLGINNYIISNYDGGTFVNGDVRFDYGNDNKIRVQFGQGNNTGVAYISSNANEMSANRWYHVAINYDPSRASNDKVKLYIDGVEKSIDSEGSQEGNGGTIFNNSIVLRIGGSPYPEYSKILTDDLKIYNYPRTQKQIIADMNGESVGIGQKSVGIKEPVGFWDFDEGQGSTANNKGNGGTSKNGTVNSGTWSQAGKFGKGVNLTGSTGSNVSVPDFSY